jgi:hypothetical protein
MLELIKKVRDERARRAKERKDRDDDDRGGPGPSAFAFNIPAWFAPRGGNGPALA